MPLLDAWGHEIRLTPKRGRPRKKPKNIPVKYRVASKSVTALSQNQPVEVTLLARHNINGTPYGPGTVVVPRALAAVLREQERRAQWSDANFAGTRACIVGPGRTKGGLSVRQVAPEYFDVGVESAVPFGIIDRRTGNFTPY